MPRTSAVCITASPAATIIRIPRRALRVRLCVFLENPGDVYPAFVLSRAVVVFALQGVPQPEGLRVGGWPGCVRWLVGDETGARLRVSWRLLCDPE